MAKKVKEKATVIADTPIEKAVQNIEVTIPETPPKQKTKKWEIKDRMYFLVGNDKPVARILKSKGMYWFDEKLGYEREIMLTTNQKTVFVDEMKGIKRPEHIIFRDGMLSVPKNKVVLQKLLSMYHPSLNSVYYEYNPAAEAEIEIDNIELELDAMNAANELDIDMAEAIMRVEVGSRVSEMGSKELRRDLMIFARRSPDMFLDLVNDDNIHLRNVGIKATEMGIIKLSHDNRAFNWGSNDRKLMTVPFDEHPYSALAAWFKTDEGMEVLNSIEKRLN